MKKFILIVAFLFLFTVPALAAAPMSVEDAMKEQSLNSQERKAAQDVCNEASKTLKENFNGDYQNSKAISEHASKSSCINYDPKYDKYIKPITFDYDNAIRFELLKNPALISSYKKQGNLESNLKLCNVFDVPVKQGDVVTYAVSIEKSGNTYKDVGGKYVGENFADIYNKNKLIQLFHSAGIDTVNELHYVRIVTYLFDLVYVDTPNGEYAIPYECYPALKLTAGKVYKVSDIVNTLDENYNLENKKPQPGFGGVIATSQSAKPTSAKVNYLPYACVISGVVLVGIVLLFYFKHKKSKTA